MMEGLQTGAIVGEWGHILNYCRANDENIIWGSPPFGIVYLLKTYV